MRYDLGNILQLVNDLPRASADLEKAITDLIRNPNAPSLMGVVANALDAYGEAIANRVTEQVLNQLDRGNG